MECPHCHKTSGEVSGWVICPWYKKPICMVHCHECKHSYDKLGATACRYWDDRKINERRQQERGDRIERLRK